MLRTGVARLLWKIHNSIEEVAPAYKNFAAWLGMEQQHGIISFNWDLQAELLLQQAHIPWSYSLASGVPIIKPHGSINWNGYRREKLLADYPWQPVGPSSMLSFDPNKPLSNPDESGINRNLNYMLFPGDPDLPEFDEDVRLLWRDASCLIDRADMVVFVGYSLPDYDSYARKFFKDSLHGKNIIVVNPSTDDLRRFTSVFGTDAQLRHEKFLECPYAQPVREELTTT